MIKKSVQFYVYLCNSGSTFMNYEVTMGHCKWRQSDGLVYQRMENDGEGAGPGGGGGAGNI